MKGDGVGAGGPQGLRGSAVANRCRRGSRVEDRQVTAVRALRSAELHGDVASEGRSDAASEGPGEGADLLLDDEHLYAAAVAALGMSPAMLRRMLGVASPLDVWEQLRDGRHQLDPAGRYRPRAAAYSPQAVGAACIAAGVEVLLLGEARYPSFLAADPEAPAVLFIAGAGAGARGEEGGIGSAGAGAGARGEEGRVGGARGAGGVRRGGDLDHRRRVAVVGTRAPTRAGQSTAVDLGLGLASAGVVVVSGLARGIDAAAHRGALAAGGSTPLLGILGNAVDLRLAREADELRLEVARQGVLYSEVPPGAVGSRWMFAVRNRIMAAAAEVVVVVESHARGGSLYTVRAARRRGRAVAVVPGSVHSPASAGTNALLAQRQAVAVRHADDVLRLLAVLDEGSGDASVPVCPPARLFVGGAPTSRRHRPPAPTSAPGRLEAVVRARSADPQDPVASTVTELQPTLDGAIAPAAVLAPEGAMSPVAAFRPGSARASAHPLPASASVRELASAKSVVGGESDDQSVAAAVSVGEDDELRVAMTSGAGDDRSVAWAVLNVLDDQPASIDTVTGRCGLRIGETALVLEHLADAGLADHENGWWTRAITPARPSTHLGPSVGSTFS